MSSYQQCGVSTRQTDKWLPTEYLRMYQYPTHSPPYQQESSHQDTPFDHSFVHCIIAQTGHLSQNPSIKSARLIGFRTAQLNPSLKLIQIRAASPPSSPSTAALLLTCALPFVAVLFAIWLASIVPPVTASGGGVGSDVPRGRPKKSRLILRGFAVDAVGLRFSLSSVVVRVEGTGYMAEEALSAPAPRAWRERDAWRIFSLRSSWSRTWRMA